MKNLTVSLPESVLDRLRVLAAEKRMSVNRFVREILTDSTSDSDAEWRERHKALREELGLRKMEGEWNREELYAERLG